MRVLLISPNCSPGGSETKTGFQLARALGNYVEAVVVTHNFFEWSIEDAGGLGNTRAVYLDLHEMVKRGNAICSRLGLSAAGETILRLPLSIAFEEMVWKRFESDLKGGKFDLIHRLTPQSSALPSPIASKSPVPFVIGPINGGLPYPEQFRREMWQEREWLRYVRGLVRFVPYYLSTYRKAAAILGSGQHTIDRLPIRDSSKVFHFTEMGFDPNSFQQVMDRSAGDRLTFIFVGRLVPFKCPRIAIAAFGASPILRRHRLLIIGDGPDRRALEQQVVSLGLEGSVELTGALTLDEVAAHLQSADVFVFPSIRESGGTAVAEAMACGLPCVVTDYGGPGETVTSESGFKVPLANPEEMIVGFRRRLEQLAEDPELRKSFGAAAADCIRRNYTWDSKARMIQEVYRWVLGQRPDKPDLYSLWRDYELAQPR
jgi:glycosyltransferase involved in cell wall biosynthesis